MQKQYKVEIEFDILEITVMAKNKTEARKKAMSRLKRRSPISLIKKHYRTGKREILIDEW